MAEAKLGAFFLNCQEGMIFRLTLEDLSHPQPKIPVHCNNATTVGIANNTIKGQQSRSMEMRYFWVEDKVAQYLYCTRRAPVCSKKKLREVSVWNTHHQNGRNDVLITYCTGDWLAKLGFVPASINNCNLSYHGSAQQLCSQGQNDILVRGGCRPC